MEVTHGAELFFFKKPEGAFCSNFTIRTNNNVIIREYLSDYFMWFTAVIQIFFLLSGVGQHHSHMFAKYASNKTFPLSLVEVSVWFVPKLAELWSRHSLGHLQLLLIIFLLDTEEDSCLSFNRNLYLTFNKPPFVNNNNNIIIMEYISFIAICFYTCWLYAVGQAYFRTHTADGGTFIYFTLSEPV